MLAQTFQGLGYLVTRQPFSIPAYDRRLPGLVVLGDEAVEIRAEPLERSSEGTIEGEIVFAALGTSENFAKAGVRGKVALVERGTIRFQEKADNAARAGAAAMVVFNNQPGGFSGVLATESAVPVLAVSREDGQTLAARALSGPVRVRVSVRRVEMPSQNVIAELLGAGRGVVVIGGHYDTVAGVPGAADNASGIGVMLSVAEQVARTEFPFTVRFVGFGGEELGLRGSRAYVANLAADARQEIIAFINLDVVGGRAPLAVDGSAEMIERFRALARESQADLRALSEDVPSDHITFLQAGIPAVILTTPDFSVIHTPQDTVDKLMNAPMGDAAALVLSYLQSMRQQNPRNAR
jgi:aminopeptidase YwaD